MSAQKKAEENGCFGYLKKLGAFHSTFKKEREEINPIFSPSFLHGRKVSAGGRYINKTGLLELGKF
ncbi:MAG: hypothetical protein FH748_14040 [Balneolaceae bacterium]|nr:hypothetical protein [Balneolaceae bacterium]